MSSLTVEQQQAVTLIDRAVTLVAAAGSGKTTVLVRRYLELLRRGNTPSQILTVTFTKDAAEQLRERIVAALRFEWELPADSETVRAVEGTSAIGTLHGFCYNVLNQFGSTLGLPRITSILDPFARAEHFERAYRRWQEKQSPQSLGEWLAHFQPHDLRNLAETAYHERHALRESLERPSEIESPSEGTLRALLARLDRELLQPLDADLNARGIYGFDDLEHLTRRLLRESPEAARKLREQLRYFLVDEFQDTSRLQWQILEILLHGRYDRLFVVGDPKQSIYSFRHADVRLFHETAQKLSGQGGELLELTTNFRSRPELIAGVNALSETLFATSAIGFSAMRSPEGETREVEAPGEIRVRTYPGGDGKSAQLAAAEIAQVVQAAREKLRACEPRELALLFRVSDRIADYARALELAGIPVSCKRSGRLFATYEASDLLQYLRALANPLDDHTLGAFLRSPYIGFGVEDLWQLAALPGDSLLERLLRAPESLRGRASWLFGVVESGTSDVREALDALFAHSAYWPRESTVLLELLGPLTSERLSVADALERIAMWEKADILFQSETRASDNALELMTVHGSKGLEFEHVFLVDNLRRSPKQYPILRVQPDSAPGLRYRVDDELTSTPTYEQLQDSQTRAAAEESHRILYVALTRAKQSLTIFLPESPLHIPKGTWGELLYQQFASEN